MDQAAPDAAIGARERHEGSLPAAVVDMLPHIEEKAAAMAREAGRILSASFGKPIEVEYKDEAKHDPVTAADKESQSYLMQAITEAFPDHGILGEEGAEEGEDSPAPDFLWVLDPLDGTTNFLNGLPIYAVSIGVLYRGLPVAGGLYVPWPSHDGGLVLHARRGGGAYADGETLSLEEPEEGPVANRLTGLPGTLGGQYRMGKALRGKVGEPRVSGSVAYELAMVARGVMQYAIIGGPRLWDMAAGALVVAEAGGAVMLRRGRHWEPMGLLVPKWEDHPPTMKELRRWVGPLVAGNAKAAPFVAANLRRRRLSLSARLVRWLRRRRRGQSSEPSSGARAHRP